MFVSEVSDQFVGHAQASYYRALLEAGVRIWLYPAPARQHFTVDDDVAVIGSSNMDMRSFGLNYEVSLMPHREVVARCAVSRTPTARLPRASPWPSGHPPAPEQVRRQRDAADSATAVSGRGEGASGQR